MLKSQAVFCSLNMMLHSNRNFFKLKQSLTVIFINAKQVVTLSTYIKENYNYKGFRKVFVNLSGLSFVI